MFSVCGSLKISLLKVLQSRFEYYVLTRHENKSGLAFSFFSYVPICTTQFYFSYKATEWTQKTWNNAYKLYGLLLWELWSLTVTITYLLILVYFFFFWKMEIIPCFCLSIFHLLHSAPHKGDESSPPLNFFLFLTYINILIVYDLLQTPVSQHLSRVSHSPCVKN